VDIVALEFIERHSNGCINFVTHNFQFSIIN
jgi:hypothetical protein